MLIPHYMAPDRALDLSQPVTLTPAQCRAARGWLDWPIKVLAAKANVCLSTVARLERGDAAHPYTALKLRSIFEAAGITFLLDNGIRWGGP